MTAKQAKALSALLNNPTQERAAAAAGIGISTLKRYLADPDFQAEYQKAMSKLIEGAATQAKQSLSPALSCLREIVNDGRKSDCILSSNNPWFCQSKFLGIATEIPW